jgi:ATP-binding cassette subfamily B protein
LALGNNIFLAGSPRFVMEALGIILIIILAYTLNQQSDGIATTLPVLGALALGAQRLLPALQQSYAAWASIVGSQAALADTLEFLDQPLPPNMLKPAQSSIAFQNTIQFKAIRFRYNVYTPWVLDGIDLTIRKGTRIGIVGGTGSGKSTLLDLLMGLMEPEQGSLLVDGGVIDGESCRAWQSTLAHVPQSIYLADTTLAENIAFGTSRKEIDMDRLRLAAQQAKIADFIENLPERYDACVGERGVRLSGGQRQRVGIARALYKRASVLIFDEATSALDNATEREVIGAIAGLERNLTIIIVAHRMSTVKHCDEIVELKDGRIAAQGTYEYLLKHSPSFRKLAMTKDSEQFFP